MIASLIGLKKYFPLWVLVGVRLESLELVLVALQKRQCFWLKSLLVKRLTSKILSIKNGPQNETEQLRLHIYNRVNSLGIGAQGLGGLTIVLDVKIKEYPTHAACKPVALIPSCAATRHVHFVLDGSGAFDLPAPKIEDWPVIKQTQNNDVKRINLDTVTREEIEALRSGDNILIRGKILTGRDAAHKRLQDMYNAGEEFPVGLKDRFIYYFGPVDPVGDEVVGPAGPTTCYTHG